jgi:hypothetical protein
LAAAKREQLKVLGLFGISFPKGIQCIFYTPFVLSERSVAGK